MAKLDFSLQVLGTSEDPAWRASGEKAEADSRGGGVSEVSRLAGIRGA